MLPIPPPLQAQFEDHLRKKAVPKQNHGMFKKWLRYYLDFCEKYQFPATGKESLREFLGKLREKRQTEAQQEQAARAIGVFYEILDGKPPTQRPPMDLGSAPVPKPFHKGVKERYIHEDSSKAWGARGVSHQNLQSPKRAFQQEGSRRDRAEQRPGSAPVSMATPTPRRGVDTAEKKSAERSDVTSAVASRQTISGRGASWAAEYAALANEIKVRHYSPKTLNTYRGWVRKFQAFTKSKQPLSLSTHDVKEFLTFLQG